jgi:signal transduction histidine kinase
MRTKDDPQLAWSALDLLPQAVLVCEGGGAILFRNLEATRSLPRGDDACQVLRGSDPGGLPWACDVVSLQAEPSGLVHRNVSLAGAGGRRVLADVYLRALDCSSPQPPAEESAPAVLVVVEDVSLRASAERRLAVSERLAAEAKVAARTAHELNNPLDGVLRYIGLAQRELEGRPRQAARAREHLAKAQEGLLRMGGIVGDMLSQGRSSHETLGNLLREAASAFAPRAEATGVTVTCDLAAGGDTGADARLFQVFCNVLKNALDAMPAGGVLTIRTQLERDRCTVEFADTGCGLTDDQAQRVFEPFYTTKPPGAGLGLGLSISREIVAALGGSIAAAPRNGGGAVLTIALPVDRPKGPRPVCPAGAAQRG